METVVAVARCAIPAGVRGAVGLRFAVAGGAPVELALGVEQLMALFQTIAEPARHSEPVDDPAAAARLAQSLGSPDGSPHRARLASASLPPGHPDQKSPSIEMRFELAGGVTIPLLVPLADLRTAFGLLGRSALPEPPPDRH